MRIDVVQDRTSGQILVCADVRYVCVQNILPKRFEHDIDWHHCVPIGDHWEEKESRIRQSNFGQKRDRAGLITGVRSWPTAHNIQIVHV